METLTTIGNELYNLLLSINPAYIAAALGSGVIVAAIGISKKIIKVVKDIESSKWFGVLTLVVTALGALLDYIIAHGSTIAAYGKTYATLLAGATIIYHGIVYPTRIAIAWYQAHKNPIADKINQVVETAQNNETSTSVVSTADNGNEAVVTTLDPTPEAPTTPTASF